MAAKRDELWETLVTVCGADTSEMTRSERGRYNHALKQLKEVGATPEQLRARAGRYRARYQGIDLTPTALAAHWSSLRPPHRTATEVAVVEENRPGNQVLPCSVHNVRNCTVCIERARHEFFESLRTVRIGELPE